MQLSMGAGRAVNRRRAAISWKPASRIGRFVFDFHQVDVVEENQ